VVCLDDFSATYFVTCRKAHSNVLSVIFWAATATLGGLLFGFDIAIITGAGPFLAERFNP
jgi:hypothetical protein